MLALGMGLLFVGYTVSLYGYILIKGYDISFAQMFGSNWPPTAVQGGNYTKVGSK